MRSIGNSPIISKSCAFFAALAFAANPTPGACAGDDLKKDRVGTIVDANSGDGMADAKVIVVWTSHSESDAGASNNCVARTVVPTDALGKFHIVFPSEADSAQLGTQNANLDWEVTVFKAGYIGQKDLSVLNKPNFQKHFFDQEPELRGSVTSAGLKSLPMVRAKMSFEQLVFYYQKELIGSHCGVNQNQSDYDEIKRQIADILGPIPCSEPADEKVSGSSAIKYTLQTLDRGRRVANRLVALGEPNAGPWKDTTMGDLCEAWKASGSTP